MAVLEVCDLTKSYGGQQVLRGVSFSLEKGEVLSIIGSSGSGKTTLLRCLNFLETPQSGSIAVNGEVLFDAAQPEKPTPDSIRRKRLHFGLVFQSFNLFPQYTVCLLYTSRWICRAANLPQNSWTFRWTFCT